MDPFSLGLIVLAISTAIFYIVFFTFIYYWHLVKVTFVIVPVIWVFEFFVIGLLSVAIVSIVIQYGPDLIKAGNF